MSRLASVLAIWLLLLTASAVLMAAGGLRINLSGSMPAGFYRLTAARIERGFTSSDATGAGTGLSGPRMGL